MSEEIIEEKKEKKPKKSFVPKVMKELEAIKLTEKVMATNNTNPDNPMGKMTVKMLDPKEKGKTVKCSKASAIDWVVTGYGEIVD